MPPKISIITPTYNAGTTIRQAVNSVLAQGYHDIEHIIVDGGSTDDTLSILSEFPHLRVRTGPDQGQSDAMNIGFGMAEGAIIGYLNADDIYLPEAFARILPYFEDGTEFVVGNVLVLKADGTCWLNVPSTDHIAMMHHWEGDAFCLNPVGYFYRREVQEAVGGFNVGNHFTMDLEFLLECGARYPFTKIDDPFPLGIFYSHEETKTRSQSREDDNLWTTGNFAFLERHIDALSPEGRSAFRKHQRSGYRCRRRGQIAAQLSARLPSAPGTTRKAIINLRILSNRALNWLERNATRSR